MRLFFLSVPVAALCACAPPALGPRTGTQSVAPATAGPFTVPMDPGTIACANLSNPTALNAATDWALGKARGAVLAGNLAGVPDTADLSGNLASHCASNPGDTVRRAAQQLGIN